MQDDILLSILLVGADEDQGQALENILESHYEVLATGSSDQARRYIAGVRPDCVIIDHCTILDSLDLVGDLSFSGITSIVVTDPGDATTAVEAIKRGAMDCLVRDALRPTDLLRIISNAIERGQLRRKVDEQAASIEAHEKLLSEVLESLPVGVCVLDALGTVEYLNDGARQILGQNIEMGRTFKEYLSPEDLFVCDSDDPYPIRELPILTALSGTQTAAELEVDVDKPRRARVHMSASPILAKDGEVRHAVATLQDVTEQHRVEIQMRQAQRMESVGQLAGGIAHDFNNLLTIIYSCSSLALEGLEETHPLFSDLQQIVSTTRRADRLTSQLLAFSRRQIVRPEVLDTNQVLNNLEPMLRQAIGETIDLQLELEHDVWACKMDSGALEQVILNLAVNARDAMAGGGTLTIRTDGFSADANYGPRRRVEVPVGDYTRIRVKDSGSGIGTVDLDRIFEPFFTTKPVGEGTGLGLATCYGLIKQAGGFIWVQTEMEVGTSFEVVLPRVKARVRTTEVAVLHRPTAGHETILVAEDNRLVRHLTERILRRLGYRVLSAANGEEALVVANGYSKDIDLLLTDVLMPKMNGRELADQFKAQRPTSRVLYMSGWPDNVLELHGVSVAVDLVPKPFTPGDLGEMVRAVLDRVA